MWDIIKQTHYPIPTPEQLRYEFRGSETFSIVNMNQAFEHMDMDKESLNLFVCNMLFRLHKFNGLMQGISPASAECHEALRCVYKGIPGLVQIKDDLVIHGKGKAHD